MDNSCFMVVSTGSTTVLFYQPPQVFRWLSLSKPRYFYQPPRSFRWLSSSKPRPFYQTPLIFRWLSLSKPHSFYQTPQVFPVVELVETTLFFINHRGFFRWLSLSKPPFLSTTEGVTALPCAKRIQGCLWRQGSGVLVEVLELRSFLQQSLLRNRHRQKAEKLLGSSLKEFP